MRVDKESAFKSKSGITRLSNATRYALSGLLEAYRHEAAIRQEVALMLVTIPIALYLGNGAIEKVLLVGSVFGVFIVELLNSAIEAAVDHTSLQQNPFAARAKDIAAAAVLMSILLAIFVWALMLLA